MFEYMYKIQKEELDLTCGSVKVKHIIFDPLKIEEALPNIIFEEKNLKHIFAEEKLGEHEKFNIYKRFIPASEIGGDRDTYIQNRMDGNVNFYSFLAEGILGLVYRDMYGFELAKGVIDVTSTLEDTHTGVDACMYNLERGVIVLGEAKFYKNLKQGMEKIIEDFKDNNIKNKIESLYRNSINNKVLCKFVIKNLEKENYKELKLEEFMNQKIIFAGFVLHSETDVSNYGEKTFYDKYKINIEQLKENIAKCLELESVFGEYEIVLVHLPVQDKKQLIIKMIDKAEEELAWL